MRCNLGVCKLKCLICRSDLGGIAETKSFHALARSASSSPSLLAAELKREVTFAFVPGVLRDLCCDVDTLTTKPERKCLLRCCDVGAKGVFDSVVRRRLLAGTTSRRDPSSLRRLTLTWACSRDGIGVTAIGLSSTEAGSRLAISWMELVDMLGAGVGKVDAGWIGDVASVVSCVGANTEVALVVEISVVVGMVMELEPGEQAEAGSCGEVSALASLQPCFLNSLWARASSSEGVSYVRNAGQTTAWKWRSCRPSCVVTRSSNSMVESVCSRSFANACQVHMAKSNLEITSSYSAGKSPSNAGMQHYE
jgi:hypothetical protein